MIPGLQEIFNNSPAKDKFPSGTNLGGLISQTLNLVIPLVAFLMLFWMAWGIFEYIFAGGSKEALGKARSRIIWSIIGFVLVVLAFTLWQFLGGLLPTQSVIVPAIRQP